MLIRVHRTPKNTKFTPIGLRDCPVDIGKLSACRVIDEFWEGIGLLGWNTSLPTNSPALDWHYHILLIVTGFKTQRKVEGMSNLVWNMS